MYFVEPDLLANNLILLNFNFNNHIYQPEPLCLFRISFLSIEIVSNRFSIENVQEFAVL